MADIEAFKAGYREILKLYFAREEEKALFEVAELGKNLVALRLGPDVLLDIHASCIRESVKDLDPMVISRMVVNANEVLLSGMMAYAMSYYSFLDVLDAEMKKTEEAKAGLVVERNKLDDIVSSIDADLLLLDRDMRIVWVNRRLRERHPYIKGDIVGHPCNKAYCNIEEVPGTCPAKLALDTGKPVRQEHPITHPDGTVRFYYFTCSPIKDSEGNYTHVLELVQDITEKHTIDEELRVKSAELEVVNVKLKELDRLKSIFIASMSHELRTPLNSVIGFSSMLHKEWVGPVSDEQKTMLLTILRAGKHLLLLINDVIDISKIESGKLDTYTENFDLYDVINEAVDGIRKDAVDKKLELKTETLHLPMHSDRRRLLQCVLNLLSNAVKFTEKGSVHITARRIQKSDARIQNNEKVLQCDYVEIFVEDTGIGIKEEDMPRLFCSFVRLDSPLRTIVPGTGLGLYLTRKLIRETLNGDIFAESGHGVGSRFTIRIPVRIENPSKG